MPEEQAVSIGLKSNQQLIHFLGQFLSDTYVLYVKTQHFHWNVIDRRFFSLHKLFEEHYTELAEAIDIIAERIRMLGSAAPGSMKQFLALCTLEEVDKIPSGQEMIAILCEDHEAIARSIRPKIEKASQSHDEGTADMLINRLRAHEKMAWMLRSHLTT